MHTLHTPHDWLETVPELDVPTAEDVQLEMDILSGTTHQFAGADDWADCCEA